MLPFVVGGGILIALSFLFDTIYCARNGLPYGSDFGGMTALSAWFNSIGGAAFGFMLPVLAGFIAMSIADRPGLAVGFVGGYLAKIGATWAAPGGQDVSAGFLGALLAGFLAGFIVNWLKKLTSKFPPSLDGIRPMLIYPLLGCAIIAAVMCTVDPVMIAINNGISTFLNFLYAKNLIVLLGLLLGLMMATDMGGPINKAAYLFGVGMLSLGTDAGYLMMACVMIGGMVPPIAIAMACQFFPQKFTAQERSTAATNYVMGLSFITEGAIPFAASDPAHVRHSCHDGRLRCRRCSLRALQVHAHGSSRRYLRLCHGRQMVLLLDRSGSRCPCRHGDAWPPQEGHRLQGRDRRGKGSQESCQSQEGVNAHSIIN